jgi:nucleotidyltransferase/DNA polymerase involved in DNA repair
VVIQAHEVVSCNAAAAARGVRRGSSRASARAVCPELLCIERNGDALRAEAAALQRLAGWAYGLTATVSPQPPDALLLEIEGSLRLFGGQKALQARIQTDLADDGVHGAARRGAHAHGRAAAGPRRHPARAPARWPSCGPGCCAPSTPCRCAAEPSTAGSASAWKAWASTISAPC